jgi:hypothetical protein
MEAPFAYTISDAVEEATMLAYVTLQMAEIAVPRQMFADILSLIARLRAPPAPA